VPLNFADQSVAYDANPKDGAICYDGKGDLWMVSDTLATNGTHRDIYEWSVVNNYCVRDTGLVGPASAKAITHGLVFNPNDGRIYGMADETDGDMTDSSGKIFWFTPDSTTESADAISGDTDHAPGSNIFMFDGQVMWYDGNKVWWDSSGTGTLVTDDGLGYDMLADPTFFDLAQATDPIFVAGAMNLAQSTDRGIFYVKNVATKEGPQARIFRVEVTDSGSYIRRPIGSLPVGLLAVDTQWHMDSLLINVTPDWEFMRDNNDTSMALPQIQTWHYTQGAIGAIGTFTGKTNRAAYNPESPWCFLGSEGGTVYMASHRGVWVFDTINGGLHMMFEMETPNKPGIVSMANVINSSGTMTKVFFFYDGQTELKKEYDVAMRTGAWDDDDMYTLESNWFDFGLPNETKQLQELTYVLGEGGTADTSTYVEIKTNDIANAWTSVETLTGATDGGLVTEDLTPDNITGHRFKYRVTQSYGSNPPNRVPLRSIMFKALSGETVERWLLTLDGTEIENVEGVKQRPDTVYDNLVTSAQTFGFVSFSDHYGKTTADPVTSIDVRVDRVVLTENEQGESLIQVLITKVDP
jgi:hypothetical protein